MQWIFNNKLNSLWVYFDLSDTLKYVVEEAIYYLSSYRVYVNLHNKSSGATSF